MNIVCLWNSLGGEVFADKSHVKFIDSIGDTKHAKNIPIDISTNATLITEEVVNVLNKFAGGTPRFSIDSFEKEDEYIRYLQHWQSVYKHDKREKATQGMEISHTDNSSNVKLFDNG